jgi:hypothetical protein
MFRKALSRMRDSASNTMVATDAAGIDQTVWAGQRASATMHHAEPKSVRMDAPATQPRTRATLDMPSQYRLEGVARNGFQSWRCNRPADNMLRPGLRTVIQLAKPDVNPQVLTSFDSVHI